MESEKQEPRAPTSKAEQCLKLETGDLQCSVCHDLFTAPKLLPCAHVICRQCLLAWLSTNHEATCPLCRCAIVEGMKETAAPEEVWDKVVSELPDDVAMVALVENTRLLHADHVCVGCRQCQAVSVCLNCRDMLCQACTTTHRNLTATKYHKVECLSTMTAEKLSKSQPAFCCVHPDRSSELFCPTHGTAICHLCASSVHRACPEVMLFEERLRILDQILIEDSKKLLKLDKTLELEVYTLDSKLKESEEKTNQSLVEIDGACNRLKNSVKECKLKLQELVLTASKEAKQSILEAKAGLLTRRGRIASHRRLVDRVQLTSPPGKLEQASKCIYSFVQTTDNNTTFDVSGIIISQMHVDFGIVKLLEKELAFLGETHCSSEAKLWRFISTPNVILSCSGKTAERVTGSSGIVFADNPIGTGILYEVVIDEVQGNSTDTFPCGIVKFKPADLMKSLPDRALLGSNDAILFGYSVYVYGVQRDFEIGVKLKRLKEGTRVGLLRDPGGFLHLYVNGERQWIIVNNVSSNCYAFFDLLNAYRKITCLPPTAVQKGL